jgi:hypothetical protein
MDKNQHTPRPKATLYCADFRIKEITPANGLYFTLAEMQKYVGGLIEIIPLDREGLEDKLLVVNEEGKLTGLAGEYHETDPLVIMEVDPGLIIEIAPPLIM